MASAMMESLFQRTLDDLVKGLRLQMIGESRYLAKALDEVVKEIKSTDPVIKVTALQKLTYLQMLHGADMSWASFHVVEVMTMPKFAYKKIGYLAASQSFHEGTDVLVLTTNLLRKDMGSKNEYETGMAIECLSRISNSDLAAALTPEVFTMMASSRTYVRKKATLVLLRVFSKYPDAIRVAFKRLVEKLDDADPQVVCAAVSVLCELTLKDPRAYLPLAPEFYRLLENSNNNWLSIKLVKIFGALTPLEPRLGRKVAGPLCDHMSKTHAKSLLFECIRTVTLGLTDHVGAVKLAVEKLREMMGQGDPNLKYLGLRALAALMDAHPWAVAESKEVIVKCLNDGDPSIQRRSLVLIMGMVSESNLAETVQVLLQYAHSSEPIFGNELISSILSTCSRARYELVSDFPWYVSVLAEIARIPHCENGDEVGRQLMDIALRVESVRIDVMKVARDLIVDPAFLGRPALQGVLCAAAWVVGEYAGLAPFGPFELLQALLQPRTRLLPFSVHAVYLQGVLKVFVLFASACQSKSHVKSSIDGQGRTEIQPSQNEGGLLDAAVGLVNDNVTPLVNSVDMEVQERACNLLGVLDVLGSQKSENTEKPPGEGFAAISALCEVFAIGLGPVSVHAQGRVGLPEGLLIEETLDALGPIGGAEELLLQTGEEKPSSTYREWEAEFSFQQHGKEDPSLLDSSAALLAQHRHRHENYYLPSDSTSMEYPPPFLSQMAPAEYGEASTLSVEPSTGSESSLLWTKPKQAKARRPVVVKLDDEDDSLSAPVNKKGLKDEFVVSAIRDALSADGNRNWVGGDGLETSHRSSSSSRRPRHNQRSTKGHENGFKEKSSSKTEKVGVSGDGYVNDGDRLISDATRKEQGRSKHRSSKHEILVIEKGSGSSENEKEGTFELNKKKKHKHWSSQRRSRHHPRSPLPPPENSTSIPDFLL